MTLFSGRLSLAALKKLERVSLCAFLPFTECHCILQPDKFAFWQDLDVRCTGRPERRSLKSRVLVDVVWRWWFLFILTTKLFSSVLYSRYTGKISFGRMGETDMDGCGEGCPLHRKCLVFPKAVLHFSALSYVVEQKVYNPCIVHTCKHSECVNWKFLSTLKEAFVHMPQWLRTKEIDKSNLHGELFQCITIHNTFLTSTASSQFCTLMNMRSIWWLARFCYFSWSINRL